MKFSKQLIKKLFFVISLLVISPVLILFLLLRLINNSDSLFTGFSQFLSLIPGKSGSYLRTGFYRYTMTQCCNDAVISFLVIFAQKDTEIAQGVYIGPHSNIGSCKIGQHCLIGSGVHIMSGRNQHQFDDINTLIKDQGGTFEKITIGEDCWIGNGALILANIGKKCIVASGSVVIDDVSDYSIVAGNPARVVKSRKT